MADPKPQTERSQEKFPKTRTFPEGWDMSNHEAASNGNSACASETDYSSDSDQEAQSPRSPEKFPKTTTMPSGWIF